MDEQELNERTTHYHKALELLNETGREAVKFMRLEDFVCAEIMHAVQSVWLSSNSDEGREVFLKHLQHTLDGAIAQAKVVYNAETCAEIRAQLEKMKKQEEETTQLTEEAPGK